VDARDWVLAFGPDLDTVPTSGNTSRQQAKILAVLNESRLPNLKFLENLSGLSLGIVPLWKIPKE
jgi:hypothetical protein